MDSITPWGPQQPVQYRNNNPFFTFQGMRMSGESTEIMHLTQLERESAGAYACGATNTEGETRSSSLTLKVQCKYDLRNKIYTNYMVGCWVGKGGSSTTWWNNMASRKRKLQNKIKIKKQWLPEWEFATFWGNGGWGNCLEMMHDRR